MDLSQKIAEFINLRLNADQFNMNANTEVAFIEDTSSGLVVAANRVTLKEGKTYVIKADFRLNGITTSSTMGIAIRDYTNNVQLGRDCFLISNDNATDDSQEGTLCFVIKPATDIVVGFRVLSVNIANQGLFVGNTYGTIFEII